MFRARNRAGVYVSNSNGTKVEVHQGHVLVNGRPVSRAQVSYEQGNARYSTSEASTKDSAQATVGISSTASVKN